jgi:hypothetical protein
MNRVIFIVFFIVTTFSAEAQLGITAGLNSSKEKFSYDDRKGILSWNAGITYRIFSQKSVNILPELLFTTKGVKTYPPYTSDVLSYTYHDRYVQLSVPVQKSFSPGGGDEWEGLSFQVGAGPFAAWLVNSETITETIDGKNTSSNKIGTNLKGTDYGIRAFIGMSFNNRLQMQIRYDHGLANINIGTDKVYTRALSYNFIFWFGGE